MGAIPVFSCFRFLLQMMISESVFLLDMPRKPWFGRRLAIAVPSCFLLGFLWYQLLSLIPSSFPLIIILYWLGLFGLTVGAMQFCFELEQIELLFIGTGGYATEHMSFAIARIVQYVLNGYPEVIGVAAENLIFRFFFYLLGAFLVRRFIIRPNKNNATFNPQDQRIALLSLVLLLAAVVLSVFYSQERFVPQRTLAADILLPSYGLLCCLLVLLMAFYVLRENRMDEERQMMEQLLQMANAQRKSSQEAIDIINMKCHDLKHQASALAAMHDDSARQEYVDEVKKAVSIYDADYHTGCEVLDYILREKTLLANQYNVLFSCMADGTAINFLNCADIYALMGNALDNALDRVQKESEEERTISLQIKRAGEMVLIHLENRCSCPPEFQDGLPVTDKQDKNAHGFGVKSIVYIAEKYDGDVYMRQKHGSFCLDILLPAHPAVK